MAKGGPTGTLWTQTYIYDRWGNRTNVAKTGTAAGGGIMPLDGISSLTYDNASNRLNTTISSHQFQYDVNGNQTKTLAEDGSTWVKYEYDSANRLWLVKRDSDGVMLQRFGYGATNARFQSLDAPANKWTLYAATGGNVLAEYIENSPNVPSWAKSSTYFGGNQLATITPNGQNEYVEYNHPDKLGTRLVTDQAGGTSYEQTHLPFGRTLDAESSGSTAQRFTSYERSSITKLDYAINRTYDSKLGRFSQVDPIGIEAASLIAPQTLNMYSYCGNDPVNYLDPSGLFFGSFFRWLGRLITRLLGSRVARRIAIRFVVNFALSGGNFGVAIRSVIPDILQSTGIFPDPRSTVPWMKGTRLPISLGTSTISKHVILNLLSAGQLAVWPTLLANVGTIFNSLLPKPKKKRRPGRFQTIRAAVLHFMFWVNSESIRLNKEMSAAICEKKSREIKVGTVYEGTEGSSPIPDCAQGESRVAYVHSHGKWKEEYVVGGTDYNETFSPSDRETSNNLSIQEGHVVPGYVTTPRGQLKMFTPAVIPNSSRGTITTIIKK